MTIDTIINIKATAALQKQIKKELEENEEKDIEIIINESETKEFANEDS